MEQPEFNLKEWGVKARISRENTRSRRHSASYIRNIREEAVSFRSSLTISSTASSPGYTIRDVIDPSTYSFTTALRALQARSFHGWEYMSPDGVALHSKWSEAERYISNPLSGEVPLECLSAKTLSARSFRQIKTRIAMSAPIIHPAYPQQFHKNPPITPPGDEVKKTIQDDTGGTKSGDVGIQSTAAEIRSTSPSPVPTPSIQERLIKRNATESGESSISSGRENFEEEVVRREKKTEEEDVREEVGEKRRSKQVWRWRLSWMKTRQRVILKQRSIKNLLLCHTSVC